VTNPEWTLFGRVESVMAIQALRHPPHPVRGMPPCTPSGAAVHIVILVAGLATNGPEMLRYIEYAKHTQ